MKKIVSVLLVMILMLGVLAGCKEETSRELYNDIELNKYVKVENYKGITVDTGSEEFAEFYASEFEMDIEDNNLYAEITDGAVENGDIINLDYEGKIDGVAFSGGTAQGQSLTIGSNTFIDDFEEELIGAKVGETRDVTAKFPDSYYEETLAGKEAIFTCKINAITRAQTEEQAYEAMGFDSVDEYKDDITKRAVKNYLFEYVAQSTKIVKSSTEDSDKLLDAILEQYIDLYKATYGTDLEEDLVQYGQTLESYKEQLREEILPTMTTTSMMVYYILDEEGLDINDGSSQGVDQPVIAELYKVQDVVLEYLYDQAIIK